MGFYSIVSIRASVDALKSLGYSVKVIDDDTIDFPHFHSSSVAGINPIVAGTPAIWNTALSSMERERKAMGPCLCGKQYVRFSDVSCTQDEWIHLLSEIQSGTTIENVSEFPTLQYYSCSRALVDGRYSGLNRDVTEKHGQWYIRVMKGAPYCTGDWCVFALQSDAKQTGEQSIVIRSTSAQAAAEKAETILTAISLCL